MLYLMLLKKLNLHMGHHMIWIHIGSAWCTLLINAKLISLCTCVTLQARCSVELSHRATNTEK